MGRRKEQNTVKEQLFSFSSLELQDLMIVERKQFSLLCTSSIGAIDSQYHNEKYYKIPMYVMNSFGCFW